MFGFFKKAKPIDSRTSLEGVDLHLREIPGAMEIADNVPRVNWDRVREAAKPYSDHPAINQIWTELAAQWLGILREHLGEPYDLYEGDHLLVLSPDEPAAVKRMLRTGDDAYLRLEALLRRRPEDRGFGKHVVLAFKSPRLYLDYVSFFHAESEEVRGMSSGMHISRGYRHTVLNANKGVSLRTMVHELAHNMVAHRKVPRWVNEGLAQWVEDMVPGYRAPLLDARRVRLHRRYWSWFGLKHFWDGSGFLRASSQQLSYQLSEVLFRNLCSGERARGLAEFITSADWNDAGAKACLHCFGCSLETLVEEFLGEGIGKRLAPSEKEQL